jgi:smad nuclear-interacting protein 1
VEPLDSARPSKKWRLYVFKNEEISETLHLHRQSAYLFGRDKRVADIELKHESCSKQHAVIQYRQVISNSYMLSTRSKIVILRRGRESVVFDFNFDNQPSI